MHIPDGLLHIDDLPGEAPPQYPLGQPCNECGRPLSRYNPYVTCGPCRMRLSCRIATEIAEDDAGDSHGDDKSFVWDRFPKRKAVRRGPLLPDTFHLDGWGGATDGTRVKDMP